MCRLLLAAAVVTVVPAVAVGSGFSAPSMTFAVNGRQYVAITSGPSATARRKLVNTPELKDQRNATVIYVFSL